MWRRDVESTATDVRVIGVAVAKQGEGFAYIVPARYVVDLLRRNGVTWSE
jgi:hypothetical protein